MKVTLENNRELFDHAVNGIKNIYGESLDRIILYGSVARGTNTEESDIDIAVITSDMSDEKDDMLTDLSADLNWDYDVLTSIIRIEQSNFEEWKEYSPFLINVTREGIILWKNR